MEIKVVIQEEGAKSRTEEFGKLEDARDFFASMCVEPEEVKEDVPEEQAEETPAEKPAEDISVEENPKEVSE